MYWAYVFLAIALVAVPFALSGTLAMSSGAAALVMIVFALLSVASCALAAISRHR